MTATAVLEVTRRRMDVDAVCHLFPEYGNAARARCGVPRSEQEPHLTRETQESPVCAGCGLRRCPACLRSRA